MIDKDLHLRRRKDGVEVITLVAEMPPILHGKRRKAWNDALRAFVPVRYVASGRRGFLKGDTLETDFVVIGKANPEQRWSAPKNATTGESAAALELMRERDIATVRKRILEQVYHPQPGTQHRTLGDLKPAPASIAALDQAIHMILAGA